MDIEDKPPGNPPFETPFAWIGGEGQIHALVDRFYDLMDLEPGFAALRAAHGTELANAREKLKRFLTGWMGGPQHYTEQFGHPRLRMRHHPYQLDQAARDRWVQLMDHALDQAALPAEVTPFLREFFHGTATFLMNRRQ